MITPHSWFAGLLLLTITASLAGCALVPAHVDAPEAKTTSSLPSDAEQFLTYILQARMLSPAALTLEKDRARTEFAIEKSSHRRVKLAILMALSPPALAPAALAEEAEFQALLEPLAFGTSASPEPALHAIATLLLSVAQDRKRLREQLREAVARGQAIRRAEASVQAEARILRIQVEDLEKKLNALKSIERSVTSRSAEGGVK